MKNFIFHNLADISSDNIKECDLIPFAKKGNVKEKLTEIYGENMKFDVVIGNPPYQENKNGHSLQIHFKFLKVSMAVSSRYICLIQPLNWLNDFSTLSIVKKHLIKLERYSDARKVFENVSIPSGVGVSLIDLTKNIDKTEVTENNLLEYIEVTGNFNLNDVKFKEYIKMNHSIFERLSSYVGHPNEDKTLNLEPEGELEIWFKQVRGKSGKNDWMKVNKESIPADKIIYEYKVMISSDGHAENSNTKAENIFNNKATLLYPKQISTNRPFLLKVKDALEGQLLVDYANSKFFRRLLHIQSKGNTIPRSAFALVPDLSEWKEEYDLKKKTIIH
ncbi:MAG: Eco57I restriction-modification methylase domain-containing protein [Lactovum sp.]